MHSHPGSIAPHLWHAAFLTMLPAIDQQARYAFRRLRGDEFDDAVQETVANACEAFVRLVERRCPERAFPSALARYAVAQVRAGRRVGSRLRIRDVLSPYARHHKRFVVEHLDRFDRHAGEWTELVVACRQPPIPDQVCFRLDFRAWLARLTPRQRWIALALAVGNRSGEVARMFETSPSWISQLRRRLEKSWEDFQGVEAD